MTTTQPEPLSPNLATLAKLAEQSGDAKLIESSQALTEFVDEIKRDWEGEQRERMLEFLEDRAKVMMNRIKTTTGIV